MAKKKRKPAGPGIGFESPVAKRPPKTDRLILERLVKDKATSEDLKPGQKDDPVGDAHRVLLRWAEFESSGKLARMKETQLQGDFLGEVFGAALGYDRAVDGAETWQLEQHRALGAEIPDAMLGTFRADESGEPVAVIELKGPKIDLDRDRSNGRTAVDQGWDYLVNTPESCRWLIVSNLVSFRLYERNSTKRAYEHFSLQQLIDPLEFRKFYTLLSEDGLLKVHTGAKTPWAAQLLAETRNRQREVGDELYEAYSEHRLKLIKQLHLDGKRPLDEAIEMTQRLFDRIFFIAFCEDRKLLPEDTLKAAATQPPAFSAVTNPLWQNFKTLFRFVDQGSEAAGVHGYNGGLFAEHAVDSLELDDKPYVRFFQTVGGYDFRDEVNLDVLGHLFERSITELEKIKESGLFGGDAERADEYAQMPQSAKRKRLGVYYTPPELTSRIVRYTVDELIAERYADLAAELGLDRDEALRGVLPDDAAFWEDALAILGDLRIVDPACGSGAFLFQAYDALESRYLEAIRHLGEDEDPRVVRLTDDVPRRILGDNLYGVDLSPEAVEISQLALWIRSAAPGQTLTSLADHVVHGNSLVADPEVDPHAFDWRERFADVFDRPGYRGKGGGFDCVIGNPPWERIKLQEREFFALPAPEIATASNAAKRRQLVAKLEAEAPGLHERYVAAQSSAEALSKHCRTSGEYPLCGRGDINTYAVFAELADRVVAPAGRVGLLTPSGIASDKTTKDFFASIAETDRLIRLFDFENRTKKLFPDVDGRFKFCLINFGGAEVAVDESEFVFFAHSEEELDDRKRRVRLTGRDIKLLNPNTRTCPIFRTARDAKLTKAIYRRMPVLVDRSRKSDSGNPWGIAFRRMFDQTNDAERFHEASDLRDRGLTLEGNRWTNGEAYVPVYEAKMLQAYDHRAADVVTEQSNWVRQGQTTERTLVDYQNPERLAIPRYWVADTEVVDHGATTFLGYKDVTSPTNRRTMIAAFVPRAGVVNSAPLVFVDASAALQACLLANLNSYAYDYVVRQKISNVHLNFFIVEQVPTLPPHEYEKPCPWDASQTLEAWVSERVLKLTCTAEDMLPLADACGFTAGSFNREYGGRLNRWDEAERVALMADLDAAYLHLYGVDRDDAEYLLSTFKGVHDSDPHTPGRVSLAENVLGRYDELEAASKR
ncbi:MAG: DNA methyltransferase [Planctomycetota bacterium]